MSVLAKAMALMEGASLAELDAMSPAQQRKVAELCRHWSMLADSRTRAVDLPRSGIRSQLASGERSP